MTMTNGLRDPGASRRLRPLQPFLRSDAVQPGHSLDPEEIACEEAESGKMFSNGMPEDDHGMWGGPKIDPARSGDEILDFDEDEEENDHESNFFEALEERQRNAVNPGKDTLATRALNARPAVLLKAAHASIDSGNDEAWSKLPDEEDPSTFRAAAENEITPDPYSLLEDDWEPDFEQWEFDLEQGSEEMLF